MLKERVSAVILKNKKILLVTCNNSDFFFTPGGRVELDDKSHEAAIKRELKEELGIVPISIKPYISYKARKDKKSNLLEVYCYLVRYRGKPIPKNEITEIIWYSRENFLRKVPKVALPMEKYLIPKLIEDGLL